MFCCTCSATDGDANYRESLAFFVGLLLSAASQAVPASAAKVKVKVNVDLYSALS